MIAVFLGLLVAVQSAPPATGSRVEELANGQFRVVVTMRGPSDDPSGMAEQMLRSEAAIRAEATRRCQGNGGPVPVDRGQINILPNRRWENIGTFRCLTPAAPAAPPPSGG